jgi:hypothetical protein
MIKNFIILLAFILQTGLCSAQKGLWMSFNYLPQITGMLNKDDRSYFGELYQYRTTYDQAAGMQFLYNFNDRLGVGSGLLFSSEGQKFLSIHWNTPFPGKKRLDYLKIPLFISLNSNADKKIILKVMTGVQLNYLVKSDGVILIIDRPRNYYDLQQANNTYYQKFLFATMLSAGIEYRLSQKMRLGLTFRADYAFTDAENKSASFQYMNDAPVHVYTADNPDRPKTHNYSLSPMMSLSYKLK